MNLFHAYVPADRLQALSLGQPFPDRVEGTALFADLSGFTTLTETLVNDLGPQRGAEELLVFLDQIYEPLVARVGEQHGSVIGFSGDAITCWFDGDDGRRAAACALAMQADMRAFADLRTSAGRRVSIGAKVALATGHARRFLAGYPEIQVIEVLAGAPLERLANAEHHAARGEIVLDATTAAALGGEIEIVEWRAAEARDERLAVLAGLRTAVAPRPWPALPPGALPAETVRPWLLPPVYERLRNGGGEFLAELRPAVALFLRFGSVDYENDAQAGEKLDRYVRQVQAVLARFEGSLIQLTIGEKGSYLCAAFGAPIAHEDDACRAVAAALELRRLAPDPEWEGQAQIGLSQGRMRAGAYGSSARRTYGVLGPQTNLAARLMQAAAGGQVLASPAVHKATAGAFSWAALPPLTLKGVAEPQPVFSLAEASARHAPRPQEPRYSLPMIGRQAELALIEGQLAQALAGQGQIVMLTGEAGMGKSRLVAEAIGRALRRGFDCYGGECYSYGANTSYHLWHGLLRNFFNLDPARPLEALAAALHARLAEVDPRLAQRLPLLGPVLNLPLADNDLTRSLDARRRKTLVEGLLVTCLQARARQSPLLFVLEDYHWRDPLSGELTLALARSIASLPVLILMARRSFDSPAEADPLQKLPYFNLIHLAEFSPAEAERLIRLKLEQALVARGGVPSRLVHELNRRAEGNPFYIEELLNYLRDRNLDPRDPRALDQLDLPGSLHSLILTRIDQRSESQKITLRVASVIGRLFSAAWLWGAYPELGDPAAITADLDALSRAELTLLEHAEPELNYLFKHIVTMEVAYDSLPFALRAVLHDQIAQFIERALPGEVDQHVDLLAFHYGQSHNQPKQREYWLKAGLAAQANFANQAAINYYQRLLPLLAGREQIGVLLKLGQVLELVGQWDEASALYQRGLRLGQALDDRRCQARCQIAMGELHRKRGAYPEAAGWLQLARQGFEAEGDRAGLGQVLHAAGTLAAQQGDYGAARGHYEASLAIRRELGDQTNIANLLSNLGILARSERDDALARRLYLESLEIRRALGDRWGITVSLNNLGIHAIDQGELAAGRTYLEEAVALQREIGDQYYLANYLNNLGNAARAQGDYAYASRLYRESLEKNHELGAAWQTAYVLEDVGGLAALEGQPRRAAALIAAAAALRERIQASRAPHEQARLEQFIQAARAGLGSAEWEAAWAAGRGLSTEAAVALALEDAAGRGL
ncbi:MAG: tetratricopeptide repeat protein [Anaerolineales bacterium]|nr:tetratricopeptide repeat protein [Anaerolineales bacterium]